MTMTRRRAPLTGLGEVIGASLVTTLPTLVGVALLVLSCSPNSPNVKTILHYSNSLASGILLAAAVFLLLPEASHMLAVGKTEAEAAAAWGSTVIAGWLVGTISHLAGDVVKKKFGGDAVEDVKAVEGAEQAPKVPKRMMWVLGFPISDGFVLGLC